MKRRKNHLENVVNPYLLQHANNPVDWYSWGEEAFALAKKRDKPIFLSIGYSTCHWCHVMAHESFEDDDVASLMNETFINIKVDREERPDIDHLYMTVCQQMTGAGGWPLTIIMLPDQRPFFAGTYFPKVSVSGRIGMIDLIRSVHQAWEHQRSDIMSTMKQVMDTIDQRRIEPSDVVISKDTIDQCFQQLKEGFDSEHGGFHGPPKFPSSHQLNFLLSMAVYEGNKKALSMADLTLTSMRLGGIFDQIGYGFHRYATDTIWRVPHFEKMLYDQALLLMAYGYGYQVTQNKWYKQTVYDVISYLQENLASPEGGFYSAEDADSEGEEGKFYVWSLAELKSELAPEEFTFACDFYQLSSEGNYVDEVHQKRTRNNIFHMKCTPQEWARQQSLSEEEISKKLRHISKKLKTKRDLRVHPGKDKKILTDWNGLLLAGLSQASLYLRDKDILTVASACYHFIRSSMVQNNTLYHCFCENKRSVEGLASDYAMLIWGGLSYYEATLDTDILLWAIGLQDTAISMFWDKKDGGFFFENQDNPRLMMQTKEAYDAAAPSTNAVMLFTLLKISRYTQNKRYKNYSDKIKTTFSTEIRRYPSGYTFWMQALHYDTLPETQIRLSCPDQGEVAPWITVIRAHWELCATVIISTPENEQSIKEQLEGGQDFPMINHAITAYVCRGEACEAPINDIKTFDMILSKIKKRIWPE